MPEQESANSEQGWPFRHDFEVIGGAAGDYVVVCRRCGVSGFGGALWQRLFKRMREEGRAGWQLRQRGFRIRDLKNLLEGWKQSGDQCVSLEKRPHPGAKH